MKYFFVALLTFTSTLSFAQENTTCGSVADGKNSLEIVEMLAGEKLKGDMEIAMSNHLTRVKAALISAELANSRDAKQRNALQTQIKELCETLD